MQLNKLEIYNFLSVKEAVVNFDSYGNLVRIIGKNTTLNLQGLTVQVRVLSSKLLCLRCLARPYERQTTRV